jgi:uncharacterized protein YkwD
MKSLHVILILTLFALFFASCQKNIPEPGTYDKQLLEAVNAYRTGKGLAPLETDSLLWTLAFEHSKAMAENKVDFGHSGITDRFGIIREEYGFGPTAENIDIGTGPADEVVGRWLRSIGHKSNLDDSFTSTGISAVRSKSGKYYYTQIFYKKL